MTKQNQPSVPFRKFAHFHYHEVADRIPSVTVMVEESKEDPKVWFVSWAVCNPNDQFSRKEGREIAVNKWEERGYTIILNHKWQSPIRAALAFLLTSKTVSKDHNVQIVRDALKNYVSEEEEEELSQYYKLLALAHEKTGIFMRTIEKLSSFMAR